VSSYFATSSYRPRSFLRVGVGFGVGFFSRCLFCELTAPSFALCTLLLY
jgi:hypothetical protein